jgi:hypothetical protein
MKLRAQTNHVLQIKLGSNATVGGVIGCGIIHKILYVRRILRAVEIQILRYKARLNDSIGSTSILITQVLIRLLIYIYIYITEALAFR